MAAKLESMGIRTADDVALMTDALRGDLNLNLDVTVECYHREATFCGHTVWQADRVADRGPWLVKAMPGLLTEVKSRD